MSRRDWHTLAAYATIAALLVAVAVFVVMLTAVLDKAAGDSAPITPRATPSVASRDFVRPFLTAPSSDHAAAGRDQTSAGQTQSVTTPSRTADETEGPVVSGEAATGPTAYEKLRAAISWCESRNQPTVVNRRSGAAGLFQFMPQTWEAVTGLPAPASAYSVQVQTQAFDELFARQGTRPWRASRSCWGRS